MSVLQFQFVMIDETVIGAYSGSVSEIQFYVILHQCTEQLQVQQGRIHRFAQLLLVVGWQYNCLFAIEK